MIKTIIISFVIGCAGGAGLAALTSPAAFWMGWLGCSVLLAAAAFCLLWTWRKFGAGRALGWMLILAFCLRLAGGLALQLLLPVAGYDEEVQKAGYVFFDAYQRDNQAWQLASSGEPLTAAFHGEKFISDQYGGLLALSAAVYRLLSPDAHRPVLILILAALFGGLGAAFLFSAVRKRWGEPTARIAGWIMALYPEAVLLGASQMREPFLIALFAIAFWGVLSWQDRRREAALALALSLAGMLLISWRVALVTGGVLAVWFGLDVLAESARPGWRWLGRAGGILGFLVLLAVSWNWLKEAAVWDAVLTIQGSGMMQWIFETLSKAWRVPVMTVYGLAQPVLPATIVDPAAWIWRILNILRAMGWYALAPLLLYGFFTAFKAPAGRERRVLLWLAAMSVLWILLSAARAGGDQWDNPRYRTLFLPWLALLAAWAWQFARRRHDPWLGRWLAVEGAFLLLFTNWYAVRYTGFGLKLGLPVTAVLVVLSAGLILGGGWLLDRRRSRAVAPSKDGLK